MVFLLKNKISVFLLSIVALMFSGSLYFILCHNADLNDFERIIHQEIKNAPGTGEFVEELNEWVYSNKGFAKNNDFYIFPRFGPTAKQVLANGGDCADKSRLLSTMLKSVGMDSTLVMLYGCQFCGPTHTIVNVNYDKGSMSVDPVFNIVFPKDNGEYWGVKELRDNPKLLINRLNELIIEKGFKDKIALYKRTTESYSWAKTINWKKSFFTKKIWSILSYYKGGTFLIMRPHFLETPKLFYSYFLALTGIVFLMLCILFSWLSKKPS